MSVSRKLVFLSIVCLTSIILYLGYRVSSLSGHHGKSQKLEKQLILPVSAGQSIRVQLDKVVQIPESKYFYVYGQIEYAPKLEGLGYLQINCLTLRIDNDNAIYDRRAEVAGNGLVSVAGTDLLYSRKEHRNWKSIYWAIILTVEPDITKFSKRINNEASLEKACDIFTPNKKSNAG